MFCSNCGRSIPGGLESCPNCGAPLSESRFANAQFTSAQPIIRPDSEEYKEIKLTEPQDVTKITYTSDKGKAEQGDNDSRTTYRPAFEGMSMPKEMQADMKAAIRDLKAGRKPGEGEDAAPENEETDKPAEATPVPEVSQEAPAEVSDDPEWRVNKVDTSKFRAAPIESHGQSGISEAVTSIISGIDANAEKAKERAKKREYGVYGGNDEDVVTDGDAPVDDEDEAFEEMDNEEIDELRNGSFGLVQIIKIIIGVIVVAALFVGGVMWVRHISANTSSAPITNVSEDFYTEGLTVIRKHAGAQEEALTEYKNGGLSALSTYLGAMSSELTATMPAEPKENDTLFMNALRQIETNISNCITSDALALGKGDTEAIAESDTRWAVVNNQIAMLSAATRPEELTAIANGEIVEIIDVNATPSPSPAPNYDTLSKGDKSDKVLELQNRLWELGYLLGDRDGAYGMQTQTAIKQFQQRVGLNSTGIADSVTQARLFADDAPRTEYAQPTAAPAVVEEPTAAPEQSAEETGSDAETAEETGESETGEGSGENG